MSSRTDLGLAAGVAFEPDRPVQPIHELGDVRFPLPQEPLEFLDTSLSRVKRVHLDAAKDTADLGKDFFHSSLNHLLLRRQQCLGAQAVCVDA